MPTAPIPGGLTQPQQEQLLLLLRLGADSRETAKHMFDEGARGLSPGALADNAVSRRGMGGQRTLYWLTPSGLDLAPRVAAALAKRERANA